MTTILEVIHHFLQVTGACNKGGVRNHEAHKLVVKDSETTNPSCTWKSIVAKRVEQISLNGKQQKNIIKNRAVKG